MISIRTALVAAAFVAAGLTSVAEHLVRWAQTGSAAAISAGSEDVAPGTVLRLTQKIPAAPKKPDLSPRI